MTNTPITETLYGKLHPSKKTTRPTPAGRRRSTRRGFRKLADHAGLTALKERL